jgi:hypothetical protein
MLVRDAKEIARQWVVEEASKMDSFYGAYFSGSTNWMPDDAPMPRTSDVDVKVVVDDRTKYQSYTKKSANGVVLDVSYINFEDFQSPAPMLVTYHATLHFTTPNIILDPTGQLGKIQEAVVREYATREWVSKRCENAFERLRSSLDRWYTKSMWPEKVFWWLYPFPVIFHVILVANLENPAVGNAFYHGKATLDQYGHQSFDEEVLRLLGSEKMSKAQVLDHLTALEELFDVAKTFVKTPFFGATNIADDARPIVIDRNRQHINEGYHREALFWITVYVAICQIALHNDAPKEVQDRFAPAFQDLLDDLGLSTLSDLQRRAKELQAFLPRVWEIAEDILARNPAIHD